MCPKSSQAWAGGAEAKVRRRTIAKPSFIVRIMPRATNDTVLLPRQFRVSTPNEQSARKRSRPPSLRRFRAGAQPRLGPRLAESHESRRQFGHLPEHDPVERTA